MGVSEDEFKENEERNKKIQERIKNDRLKKNKDVLKDYNIVPKPPKPTGSGSGGASNHLAY